VSGIVLVLYCGSMHELSAQDSDKPVLVDGQIFTLAGDTIEGKLLYINQYNFQFSITLTDTSGNLISYYSPKDITGFSYNLHEDQVEFISMSNPSDLGKVFLRLLYKGKYTVYQFLEINHKSSYLTFRTFYYLWDKQWLEPPITFEFETESLLYHFSDCPELDYKIKTGAYGFSNLSLILNEYESCHLTDEYEFFYE
jgi:hypothetical protein